MEEGLHDPVLDSRAVFGFLSIAGLEVPYAQNLQVADSAVFVFAVCGHFTHIRLQAKDGGAAAAVAEDLALAQPLDDEHGRSDRLAGWQSSFSLIEKQINYEGKRKGADKASLDTD